MNTKVIIFEGLIKEAREEGKQEILDKLEKLVSNYDHYNLRAFYLEIRQLIKDNSSPSEGGPHLVNPSIEGLLDNSSPKGGE